jgi:hypothetical protein
MRHAAPRHTPLATAALATRVPAPLKRCRSRDGPVKAASSRLHAELAAVHPVSSSAGHHRATPVLTATIIGRATLSSSSAGRRRAVVRVGTWAARSGRLAHWATARSGGGPQAAVQAIRAGAVPLGRERIRPIGLRFVLLFSKYIQIISKFKNLCKIHLNSKNYETNFVG